MPATLITVNMTQDLAWRVEQAAHEHALDARDYMVQNPGDEGVRVWAAEAEATWHELRAAIGMTRMPALDA